MPASLIVEDGTGMTNSNSYVTLEYARDFAEAMNLTLPTVDADLTVALLGAMPYIESRPYQGQRASATQALSWPRRLVTADGYPVAPTVVPEGVKRAQVTAAAMGFGGSDLMPTVGGALVTKEKVGPIETEYSDKYASGEVVFTSIDNYLLPFINAKGGYRLSPAFGF
jgi:hypothetical protein